MIKAVFLDIDNTLTDSRTRCIPRSAREAIELARTNGIKVCVATGRNTKTREEGAIIDGLELDGIVAINGQLCYLPDGRTISVEGIDPVDAECVRRFCAEREIPLLVGEQEHNYITIINENVIDFQNEIQIPMYEQRSFASFFGVHVLQLCPFCSEEEGKELQTMMRHSNVVRVSRANFDVIPKNAGKDAGILKMLDYFGISMKETMVLGDGGNDISMLRAAGIGVAMADGDPAALAAADEIAPSAHDDGVYRTFQKHGLI